MPTKHMLLMLRAISGGVGILFLTGCGPREVSRLECRLHEVGSFHKFKQVARYQVTPPDAVSPTIVSMFLILKDKRIVGEVRFMHRLADVEISDETEGSILVGEQEPNRFIAGRFPKIGWTFSGVLRQPPDKAAWLDLTVDHDMMGLPAISRFTGKCASVAQSVS